MCQIQGLTKSRSDNKRGGKTHTDQGRKRKPKEPQTQADQQTRGRLDVYDPALPPTPLPHTYTHRNVRTRCGPHTAEQICLKGRSCVYHSLHPACRNICEQAALFFCLCFLCAYAYCTYMCMSICWITRNRHQCLVLEVRNMKQHFNWAEFSVSSRFLSVPYLSFTSLSHLSPPFCSSPPSVWPSSSSSSLHLQSYS